MQQGQQTGSGSGSSAFFGGQSYDEFRKWIGSDPQNLAKATKAVLSELSNVPTSGQHRDVLTRELKNDPSVTAGIERIRQFTGEGVTG